MRLVTQCIECLSALFTAGWCTRTTLGDPARHIYRELNAQADFLAKSPHQATRMAATPEDICGHQRYRLYFDGSSTQDGSGMGWHLMAVGDNADSMEMLLADASFTLPVGTSAIDAELTAALHGCSFLVHICQNRVRDWYNCQAVCRPAVLPGFPPDAATFLMNKCGLGGL